MNTAVKKAAREELIAALDKDASYVDMECNGYLVRTQLLSRLAKRYQTRVCNPAKIANRVRF